MDENEEMKKKTAEVEAQEAPDGNTKAQPETEAAAKAAAAPETEASERAAAAPETETAAKEDADADKAAEAGAQSGEADADGVKQADTGAGKDAKPEAKTEGEKSSFFGKKKKKDKKDELIEDLTDRVKRTMAEFENFRKRNEREKSQMYEIGARDIIEKMLPVLDSFERGLDSIPEDQKDNAVAQGMEMIYKQMLTAFEQIGVKEIEAEGKEFDPDLHNAVMHEENEEVGENVITQVLQKGYTYRDTVIRHSMVKVAN